jgi:hypothetical protein
LLAIAVLCALCFALRIGLYAAPPPELLPDARGAWEEVHRGNTAREFLRGPLLDPIDYQINGYWGGSLVVSLLAVPLYALFGSELLILRATTFLFAGIGIASLFVLLERFHGRRAAWLGGLLYALAPPGYALLGACAWGTHVEAHALALLLCALVMRRERAPRSLRSELLLGAMMGFCVYFGRSLACTVAVLAWHELVITRTLSSGRARLARLGGFALGASPLLVLLLLRGADALALDPTNSFLDLGVPGSLARSTARLFWNDLPAALFFPDRAGIEGTTVARLYLLLLEGAALAYFVRERGMLLRSVLGRSTRDLPRESELAPVVAAHVAAFTCIYVVGGYDALARPHLFDLRYALWPFPWLVVAAAAGATGLVERAGASAGRLATGIASVLALVSVAGSCLRMDARAAQELYDAPGHSDADLGRFVLRRTSARPAALDRAMDRLVARGDPREQRAILTSIGRYLGGMARFREDDDPILREMAERGARVQAQLDQSLPPPLARIVRRQAGIPDEPLDPAAPDAPGKPH